MNKRGLNTGFTLLEMMVVVFIIAIIAAAIGLNVATESPQKRMDEIGDDLYRRMLLAADTALLSGNPIGLQIERTEAEGGAVHWQYAWYGHINNRWEILSKPLTTTKLPDSVTLVLIVEDERVEAFSESVSNVFNEAITATNTTTNRISNDDTGDFQLSQPTIQPEVVISPSGEITDFTLQLRYRGDPTEDNAVYRISVSETGELTIGGPTEKR